MPTLPDQAVLATGCSDFSFLFLLGRFVLDDDGQGVIFVNSGMSTSEVPLLLPHLCCLAVLEAPALCSISMFGMIRIAVF